MSVTIFRQEDAESITFDAVISETYNPTVSTTEHPVEYGSPITDHARTNPFTFSIRGLITESPYGEGQTGGSKRVQDILSFLRASEGKLVDVISTRDETFEDCLITAYPHDISNIRNLPLNVSFKQVRIAKSQSVIIPPRQPAVPAQAGSSSEKDAGSQSTEEDTSQTAQESRRASRLLKTIQGARRILGG